MLYQSIFNTLHERGIEYLLVGGMAVNFYGHMRMTADIDIMLSLDRVNLEKFVGMIKELKFNPTVPVQVEEILNENTRQIWYDTKKIKVLSLQNRLETEIIDVFIKNPIDFEMAYKNKVVLQPAGSGISPIYLVSLDDLIRMKQISGRPQDIADINILEKIKALKEEQLRRTMQIPIEEKLLWIEEMLLFNKLYATPEILEMQKKVRGEGK